MWSDQVDQANELAERERAAMAQVRKPTLTRTGACHSCGEAVDPASLFAMLAAETYGSCSSGTPSLVAARDKRKPGKYFLLAGLFSLLWIILAG